MQPGPHYDCLSKLPSEFVIFRAHHATPDRTKQVRLDPVQSRQSSRARWSEDYPLELVFNGAGVRMPADETAAEPIWSIMMYPQIGWYQLNAGEQPTYIHVSFD